MYWLLHLTQVSEKRWYWLKVFALATIRDWDALEKFSKEKRPPIGKVSDSVWMSLLILSFLHVSRAAYFCLLWVLNNWFESPTPDLNPLSLFFFFLLNKLYWYLCRLIVCYTQTAVKCQGQLKAVLHHFLFPNRKDYVTLLCLHAHSTPPCSLREKKSKIKRIRKKICKKRSVFGVTIMSFSSSVSFYF